MGHIRLLIRSVHSLVGGVTVVAWCSTSGPPVVVAVGGSTWGIYIMRETNNTLKRGPLDLTYYAINQYTYTWRYSQVQFRSFRPCGNRKHRPAHFHVHPRPLQGWCGLVFSPSPPAVGLGRPTRRELEAAPRVAQSCPKQKPRR